MKKFILPLFVCVLSFTLVLSGCGFTPLKNSPTQTAQMDVNGSALVYDDYIYFANSFVDASSLKSGDNKKGKVKNPAIYRVATTEGEISYNQETTLPENVEKAISKIAGFSAGIMFSVGEWIYFASPSTHKDDQKQTTFNYNSYFKVKTDGSNLSEFYTSKNTITQQSVLTIGNKTYLIVLDGSKLIKFTLSGNDVSETTLASKVTSAVFPEKSLTSDDKFAYYTTDSTDEDKENNKTGVYLHKVDITNGDKEDLNVTPANITLKSVYNGTLFFTYTETNTYFAKLTTSLSSKTTISAPIEASTFSDFAVLTASDNKEYYVLVGASATYALQSGVTLPADSNKLINSAIKLLFVDGDYVYYSVSGEGIYRISVLDKNAQKITDLTNFKNEGIAFDGTYIYFYAQLAEQSSSTYYMHRADVTVGEGNHDPKIELLSKVLEEDIPETNNEEE